MLDSFRYYVYNDLEWTALLGAPVPEYRRKLIALKEYDTMSPYLSKDAKLCILANEYIDLPHMAATTLGYSYQSIVPDFWTGWGGDLATAIKKLSELKSSNMKDKDLDYIDILMKNYYETVTSGVRRNLFLNSIGLTGSPSEATLVLKITEFMVKYVAHIVKAFAKYILYKL